MKNFLCGLFVIFSQFIFADVGGVPINVQASADPNWIRVLLPPDFSPITSFYSDSKNMYAGTYLGNLYKFNSLLNVWGVVGANRISPDAHAPGKTSIDSICINSLGNLFVSSHDNYVLKLNKSGKSWDVIDNDLVNGNHGVSSIRCVGKTVYTTAQDVTVYNDGVDTKFKKFGYSPYRYNASSLVITSDGIYTGFGYLLTKYDDVDNFWSRWNEEETVVPGSTYMIGNMLADGDSVYISAYFSHEYSAGGLYKFDAKTHSWKVLVENYGSASASSLVKHKDNIYYAAEKGVFKIDKNDKVTQLGIPTPHFGLTGIAINGDNLFVSSMNGYVYKYKLPL